MPPGMDSMGEARPSREPERRLGAQRGVRAIESGTDRLHDDFASEPERTQPRHKLGALDKRRAVQWVVEILVEQHNRRWRA